MRISEIRAGDTKSRAGLIITDGQYLLACKPTPSSRWPNPKLDIPKGHVQENENACHAAIRECYEETNILFDAWKLNHPIQFMMDGEPLHLWGVRLSEMPPIGSLSCASTFIDDSTGQRYPEMIGYEYIPLFDAQFNGVFARFQEKLRPCVEEYFNSYFIINRFDDLRICADKINLPDGIYVGLRSAYFITLSNGIKFKTINGVRGINIPCQVEVKDGFIYGGGKANGSFYRNG